MNKNLLYTAVTRARKCVCMVGNENCFHQMAQNESELEKTLRDLLAHPEKMKAMGEAALSVVAENQGATKRNVDTFAKLAEKYKIDLMENTDEY